MKDNQWKSKLTNQIPNSLVIDYPYCWKPTKKDKENKKPTIQLI